MILSTITKTGDGVAANAWSLSAQDVAEIALGATLLGAGGGGDPYLSQLAVRHCLQSGQSVEVIAPEDLADDACIACLAGFGAPTVEAEKMQSSAAMVYALRAYESRFGRRIDALIAAEMGGGNAIVPLLAAAETGLPVIDGDGMGRAFPELQMTSYHLNGVSATPFVLADDHLNVVTCELGAGAPEKMAEAFARSATIEMGMQAYIVCYLMTGAQAKRAVLAHTLTLSRVIGRAIAAARSDGDPVRRLVHLLNNAMQSQAAIHLFDGKVTDLWRSTEKGFAKGWCRLEDLKGSGATARAQFQNEYLLFTIDGVSRAMTPDLICLLDRETLQPIPTPDVRYGQRLAVLGIACHAQFRNAAALQVVGPQAFGFDEVYQPLQQLAPGSGSR